MRELLRIVSLSYLHLKSFSGAHRFLLHCLSCLASHPVHPIYAFCPITVS